MTTLFATLFLHHSLGLYSRLEADFCVEALQEALSMAQPEIFNTDQGSQFTGDEFTGMLE